MNPPTNLATVLADTTLNAKGKARAVRQLLLDGGATGADVVALAAGADDKDRATLIEGMEGATRERPALVDEATFAFLTDQLASGASRVRWESARTIGNVIVEHQANADRTIAALAGLATDDSTVVRWSAASALSRCVMKGDPAASVAETLRDAFAAESDSGVRSVVDKALAKAAKRKR